MTFKSALVGVLSLLAVQTASASKQVIQCERRINFVLFGLQSAYGEIFTGGLANVGVESSPATVAFRNRTGENRYSDAMYAGSDYDGNAIVVQFPKAVIGKIVETPFQTRTTITLNKTKQEMTLDIQCVSSVTE